MKGTGWEERGKETTDVGTTLARRARGGWGKAFPEPRGAGSPAETLVRAGTYVHCATIPWLLLLWSFSKCTRDVLGTEPSPFEWVSVCSAPARADLHHFLPACLCKKEPSNGASATQAEKRVISHVRWFMPQNESSCLPSQLEFTRYFVIKQVSCALKMGIQALLEPGLDKPPISKKMGQHNARSLNLLRYFFCQILKRNSFGE